ncbi:MAG: hypothetical protein RL483_1031 [Pseudomonadota bacterium]
MNRFETERWLATSALALALSWSAPQVMAQSVNSAEAPVVEQTQRPKRSQTQAVSKPSRPSVDINTAEARQLQEVKGIGPSMAQKIVMARKKGGPFKSAADLSRRVKGLGEKRLARLQANGLVIRPSILPEPSRPTGPDAGEPKMRK